MERLKSLEAYEQFIQTHEIAIVHISRENCSVCHAVLPRVEALVERYEGVALGHLSAEDVPEIAGALSIFTVPVDILFYEGKEMHREGRFIDLDRLESQLFKIYESINR
ncbi:thioredoxin family protein [Staphylococcus schleiferi]|uniref:thioredoxin family protein n=1 Tax=Staphylococcus schleiferi TaxID=1295 RepID=UPI00188762A5|nr:thioredoxin family protein [Staphylococcus schleiferi]MBF1993732.1 thioredoxin family protein [Staphylococcus schleiferi]MBF2039463.1 thioredoxin family protein [Staphylococcus schleiferi]MBF2101262.1 thioredoxin family protein [Staphylococcus schleiferi]MBF2103423.1 thioredoxin family protein [Staphylococcus schleiferi]MBF2105571.1 thioredoxin family protein [Staphylococcus schleiferi]